MAQTRVRRRPSDGANNGGVMWLNFLRDRLQQDAPQLLNTLGFDLQSVNIPSNLRESANNLANIAMAFAQSPLRQQVKDQAMQSGQNLTRQDLTDLVQILLLGPDGDRDLAERIVVVFFYLMDVVLYYTQLGLQRAREVFVWCRDSVVQIVDPLVQAAGGWNKIFATVAAAGILAIVAGAVVAVAVLIGKAIISK